MTDQTDTPQSAREEFDKPGRPMSDWEALSEVWHQSEAVRESCDHAFSTMVSHAYAELSTEQTPTGRERTQLIWSAIEDAGYVVHQPKPIHFVKPVKQGWFSKLTGMGARVGRQVGPRTPM